MKNFYSESNPTPVLAKLNQLKPKKHTPSSSRLCEALKQAATLVLAIGFFHFLILGLMATAHRISFISQQWITVAFWVGIISLFLSILGIALYLAGSILSLRIAYKRGAGEMEEECSHDHLVAQELVVFDLDRLQLADAWLEKRIKRAERRLGRFFGGSDKIAFLAVVGLAWVAWKSVSIDLISFTPSPVVFGLAAISGVVLGGMASSFGLERLHYQRDLLGIAIRMISLSTSL
jgi:hypothetical protein